jgi:CRISPR-associated protein Csb2
MAFVITAELPLGVYRGAAPDGRPEPMPSLARLHSALLCAAGFGPRAVPRPDGGLDLADPDVTALRWLEDHPPDAMRVPDLVVTIGRATAYRDDGTIKKSGRVLGIKKLGKSPDSGTAVGGTFEWVWHTPPPAPVLAAIESLCSDVAHLGTTESPVRLTAAQPGDTDPTHTADDAAGLFTPGAEGVTRPLPGRTTALVHAHEARTARPPSVRSDRHGTDEKSAVEPPPSVALDTRWYRRLGARSTPVPWSRAVLVPMDHVVRPRDQVVWARAVHRALVRLVGDGAPPSVTGVHPPGGPRPANHVAIQFLDAAAAGLLSSPWPASAAPRTLLAVLLPDGMASTDAEVLLDALGRLNLLRGPGGRHVALWPGDLTVVDGDRFWRPPGPGEVRLWWTASPAVPDSRGAPGWGFAQAALLSLGFVWKAHLPPAGGRGAARDEALAAQVAERGAAAVLVRAVRDSDTSRYAHRVNADAVVRPYRACLHLGDLAGPGTVQAVGQSRHLGGGLLVPLDVPEGTPVDRITLPGGAR